MSQTVPLAPANSGMLGKLLWLVPLLTLLLAFLPDGRYPDAFITELARRGVRVG